MVRTLFSGFIRDFYSKKNDQEERERPLKDAKLLLNNVIDGSRSERRDNVRERDREREGF